MNNHFLLSAYRHLLNKGMNRKEYTFTFRFETWEKTYFELI